MMVVMVVMAAMMMMLLPLLLLVVAMESRTMVMRMMVTMCVDGSDGRSSYELASFCADNVLFSLLIMRP